MPLKDRSAGLIVFGSLELLMGGCCGLMAPLMVVNVFLLRSLPEGQAPPVDMSMMVWGALFYAGLGAFFIIMGIGSIRARRWARTLMLIVSWGWLVCGVAGFVMMMTIFPDLVKQMEAGAGDSSATDIVTAVMGAIFLVFYVLVPLAFVLFYRSPHVKATCEDRDPHVPWTDRCPAPLLGASLLSAFGAASMLVVALAYRVILFFDLLTGLPAVALSLVLAAAYGFAAVELYRQRWRGWWVSLGTAVVLSVAVTVGFWNIDAVAFYEAMRYPREWAERMAPTLVSMRWFMVIWAPLWVGLLLWVRRYLPPRAAPA